MTKALKVEDMVEYHGYTIQLSNNKYDIIKDGKVISDQWLTVRGAQRKIDDLIAGASR